LSKETKATKNIRADAAAGDHPEGAVDPEVTRIADENVTDPDGLETAKTIVGASTGGTDLAGESEV
jgi:protein-tyrosine-phosphatase